MNSPLLYKMLILNSPMWTHQQNDCIVQDSWSRNLLRTFREYWFINRMGMLHRMLILVEIGQSEYINKMGKLYRMLILRASQNRQRGSSQTTETTNYTARPPLPQQQSGWSTNLVKQLDCRFGPRIAFLGAPETTNRVARPVSGRGGSSLPSARDSVPCTGEWGPVHPPAAPIPSAVRGLSPHEGGALLHGEQSPISPEY